LSSWLIDRVYKKVRPRKEFEKLEIEVLNNVC
jgi:hypothetical protein